MSQTASVWLLVAIAFFAANLPFLNDRLFAVVALTGRGKPLFVRLLELLLIYFLVGAFAMLLEQRAGRVTSQNWEFYAITGTLFLTFAFPGFVWRYLVRRHD